MFLLTELIVIDVKKLPWIFCAFFFAFLERILGFTEIFLMDEPTVLHVVNEVNESVPEDVLAAPVGELESPKEHEARGSKQSYQTDIILLTNC